MVRVLIVSDSHGLTEELAVIKERHHTDYMIHCGDSELDADSSELAGFYKVAGNCDFDTKYPNEEVVNIDDLTFFVAHGHLHNVKSNINTISYRAEEEKAQVVCFGHTHVAGAQKFGEQLLINPGSIRQPRNRIEKTYAVIQWQSRSNIHVYFYTVDGERVDELTYETSI